MYRALIIPMRLTPKQPPASGTAIVEMVWKSRLVCIDQVDMNTFFIEDTYVIIISVNIILI